MLVQDSAFSSNTNLQNLLIITALKSAPDRVPDYIHRLEGFEPKAVAQVRPPCCLLPVAGALEGWRSSAPCCRLPVVDASRLSLECFLPVACCTCFTVAAQGGPACCRCCQAVAQLPPPCCPLPVPRAPQEPRKHERVLSTAGAWLQVALDNDQPDAAFEIYRKSGHKVEALTVLTDKSRDLNRAHEYATKVDDPAVWSTLGHKQLGEGHVSDAIGSYILAKDSSKYLEVIGKAKEVRSCLCFFCVVPAKDSRTCLGGHRQGEGGAR